MTRGSNFLEQNMQKVIHKRIVPFGNKAEIGHSESSQYCIVSNRRRAPEKRSVPKTAAAWMWHTIEGAALLAFDDAAFQDALGR